MFKYTYNILSPVLELCAKYPLLVVGFTYLIVCFNWFALTFFLGCLVFSFLSYILVRLYYDLKNEFETLQFRSELENYTFNEISLNNIFSEDEMLEIRGMLRNYKDPIAKCYTPVLTNPIIRNRFFKVVPII